MLNDELRTLCVLFVFRSVLSRFNTCSLDSEISLPSRCIYHDHKESFSRAADGSVSGNALRRQCQRTRRGEHVVPCPVLVTGNARACTWYLSGGNRGHNFVSMGIVRQQVGKISTHRPPGPAPRLSFHQL